MNPKISVIVPIYGVEKYIEKCLFSLFNNTMSSECEFILVNDCTKDKSIEIAEQVISKYPDLRQNIKIISHNVNKGLAAARNTGLFASKGEYVCTVDSDDWIDLDFFEKLYNKIVLDKSDIAVCDFVREFTDKVIRFKKNFNDDPLDDLVKMLTGNSIHNVFTILFKRDLFIKNNISWTDGIDVGEDLLINIKLFICAKKVSYVEDTLYHYNFINPNSITHISDKKINNLLLLVNEAERVLNEKHLEKLVLMLKQNVKVTLVIHSYGADRKKYLKFWPETNSLSIFYHKDIRYVIFSLLLKLKMYSFCKILLDIIFGKK